MLGDRAGSSPAGIVSSLEFRNALVVMKFDVLAICVETQR